MLTVLELLKLSTEYLTKKGIDSPRLNAELLLADILHCKKLDLYLRFDQPLREEEIDQYRYYISRRGKFEPLQYITGNVDFFGLTFKVNTDVLIPRPETEILVETIIDHNKEQSNLKVLDVGTGSGNIAICLAKYLCGSTISTIDISEKSLVVAKENAEFHSVPDIKFFHGDIFDNEVQNQENYNIIVSNPPYVSKTEYPELQEEITKFEPKHAVTDDNDGISFYKKISEFAKDKLTANGKIYFEIGKGQSGEVADILKKNLFSDINIKKDYQDIDRVIYGTKI